jgi:phosphoribosyl-ATP pyrophosphohydrolase
VIIQQLYHVIKERQENPKEGSYTNKLLEQGEDEILKKIGEESIEVILAAKGQGNERLLSELGDLTYHCLVLLASRGLTVEDVEEVLIERLPTNE